MRAPVVLPNSYCPREFQHPNFFPPQCGRVTMKYLAELNSTAFEVLFRSVHWATVIACHSSHNELCYVTVIPGQPCGVAHQRMLILAHIASAGERFMLSKKRKKKNIHSGLESFLPQIMYLDCTVQNIFAIDYSPLDYIMFKM